MINTATRFHLYFVIGPREYVYEEVPTSFVEAIAAVSEHETLGVSSIMQYDYDVPPRDISKDVALELWKRLSGDYNPEHPEVWPLKFIWHHLGARQMELLIDEELIDRADEEQFRRQTSSPQITGRV